MWFIREGQGSCHDISDNSLSLYTMTATVGEYRLAEVLSVYMSVSACVCMSVSLSVCLSTCREKGFSEREKKDERRLPGSPKKVKAAVVALQKKTVS